MNKRMIILIALALLATVGVASAGTAVNEVEIRGTVVEADGAGNLGVAGSGGIYQTSYAWVPYNFAAFWYDPDDDLCTEYLNINALNPDNNRTIGEKNLTYTTSPLSQNYVYCTNVGSLGTVDGHHVTHYYIEGWMAEKYVAISTAGSTNANANKIVKLLVEFESSSDTKTLVEGEPWDLGGGFTLTADQLSIDGNKVWLILSKDGNEICESVIDAETDTRYMYIEDLSGVKNVVVFFCDVGAVFVGTKSNLVQVKYVYLIDNDVEKIETSTTYGNMEVKTASADRVVLENDGDIDLSPNTDVEIMKDMYFKVADDDVVRFYPYKLYKEPGEYDIRGTIVEAVAGGSNIAEAGIGGAGAVDYSWNPYNYAEFWYDLDDDLSTEYLTITALKPDDNRTIGVNNLIYTTSPAVQEYQFKKDNVSHNGALGTADSKPVTNYFIEGWMAEKYVAISTAGSTNANANKIVKLLVEFESSSDTKTLVEGEPWDLGGGFTLTADQLSIDGNKVWLILSKDGNEICESVIDAETDTRYMYIEDLSGVKNVVVFFCDVGAVFVGTKSNLVQVKYVYLIDNDVEKIETSTTYGNMEVKTASADRVVLENDGDIDLSPNTDVEIMKDMYFKVADDDVVRFYPYKLYKEPGEYDIRGTIVEAVAGGSNIAEAGIGGAGAVDYSWNPYNYAEFWYDLDDDLSTEYLTITALKPDDNRTIGEKNLTYTTSPAAQDYHFNKDNVSHGGSLGTVDGDPVTNYYIEGWMAEKYVAISSGGSTNRNANKIVKLLVEFETSSDKNTLAEGEPWDLGGGFTLNVTRIDVENDTVALSLAKNNLTLNETIIDTRSDDDRRYMYTEDLSGVSDVVVFFCYVDAVFSESNLTQLTYVYLIDNDVEKIETSTTYGNMEVKTASSSQIVLENDADIDLSRNTDVEIMNDMHFKVADSDTVRFYPFVERTIDGTVPTPPETIPADDVDDDGVPDVWDRDNSTPPDYWTDSDGRGRRWGDMNGDGKLTSVDALMILQAAAEKIDIG